MSFDEKLELHVSLLGDWSVGKTSIIRRFVFDQFDIQKETDYIEHSITVDGKKILLRISDSADQERFQSLTPTFCRNANGLMLVYDVSNEESFQNFYHWWCEVDRYAPSDVKVLLLGNKIDLEDARIVSTTRGQQMADQYNIRYLETSAKFGVNVEEAFTILTQDILKEMIGKNVQTPIVTYTSVNKHDKAVGANSMKVVKKHIRQQGSLDVRSLKAFLIGPSCVGKTTARRRLTEEIDHISRDVIVPSTGIDAPLTVQLYHHTEQSSVIMSACEGGWQVQQLEDQCRTICSCVLNSPAEGQSSKGSAPLRKPASSQPTAAAAATPISSVKPKPLSKLTSLLKGGWRRLTGSAKDEVTSVLTSLVKEDDWETVKEFLKEVESFTVINIVDVGGQPECHEILPLLLHGLALNLIFLNVTQDLDSPYTVVYRDSNGPSPIQYVSEFTIREIIQRALCSISSLQTTDLHKPTAILIGTHLDLSTKEAVLTLDRSIQNTFKDADFMENDVLCIVSKAGEEVRYIHPLDNVTGDSSDIMELRRLISSVVQNRFSPEKIPTAALLLQLILRMKFEVSPGWCSLDECITIAESCGISKEDLLMENGILDYLHNRFGTILFYRNIDKLNKRVIVNANIIMSPPTKMFAVSFASNNDKPKTAKHIRSTGEIPPHLMNEACSSASDENCNEIPTKEILELLKSRHILYEVRSATKETSYFVPFLLYPDHNVVKESSDPRLLASLPYSPLLFLPSIGYVPLGQFSASIVRLALDWTLDELERFRNRIRFYFSRKGERSLHVEFRTLSTHLEFRILTGAATQPINPRMILECRCELWKVFCEVALSYPHTRNVKWFLGFYCPHGLQSGGRPHPARCLTDEPQDVVCSQPGCGGVVSLENKHKCWFMDVPVAVTTIPSLQGVTCTAATASIADPTKPPEATAATPSGGHCTVTPSTGMATAACQPSVYVANLHGEVDIEDILRLHYSDILSVLQHNPSEIARILYSKRFISGSIRSTVTNTLTTLTDGAKADLLMDAIEDFLITHRNPNGMLAALLNLFEELSPVGCNVAENIRGKVERVNSPTHPLQGDLVSLFQFNESVASKIPSKWKRVGVALGLTQSRIDAIDNHRRGDPFECFSDVFKYWQSESTPEQPANWACLISVLRSYTVGEETLAEHIQSTLTI